MTVIASLNLLVFARIYLGSEFLYLRDILVNYVPYRHYFYTRLAAGEWPLWNDRVFGGMPLAGDPVLSAIYPPQLLWLLLLKLHPLHAYGIVAGLHYAVAHAGFYRLFRKTALNSPAALLGSAAVAYSGIAFSLHSAIQFLYGFALLGWTGAALIELHRNPGRKAAASFAFWLGLIALTGDAQTAYILGLVALGILTVASDRRRAATATLTGLVIACGLSAAPIVPGLELSWNSNRSERVSAEAALQWSWHPRRILDWAAPGLFNPPPANRPAFEGHGTGPVEGTPFCYPDAAPAVLTLALLPLAIARARRRDLWLYGLSGLFIMLAMGRHFGLYSLLGKILPLWSGFRYPERMILPAIIVLSVTIFRSFGMWISGEDNQRASLPVRVSLWGATILLVTASMSDSLSDEILKLTGAIGSNGYFQHVQARLLVTGLLWAGVAAVLSLKLSPLRRTVLLGIVLLFQIAATAWRGHWTVSPETFGREPAVFGSLERVLPVPQDGPPPRIVSWAMPTRQLVPDTPALAFHLWNHLNLNLVLLTPYATTSGYNSFWPAGYVAIQRATTPEAFLDLTGISAGIVRKGYQFGSPDRWNCPEGTEMADAQVCLRNDSLPLVRAPRAWETVDRLPPRNSGWDPREREYLSPLPTGATAKPSSGSAGSGARIEWISYSPERRKVRIAHGTEAPLVLGENWFPGWEASVDGHPAELLLANGFQMAVMVPAGTHEIGFRYRPASIELGLALSAASIIAIAGLWITGRREPDGTPRA